jgi:hypothetical protein
MQRRRDRRPGVEPDGDPENLPSREDDEVWIGSYSARGGSDARYHTEPGCQHLLGLARVRTAPETSVRDWDACSECLRLALPDRGPDEVWISVNQGCRGVTSYHTDAECFRLQRMKSVRTVGRDDLTGVLGDLDECSTCDEGYYESRSKTGDQLCSFLEREDVTPQNYQQKLREWDPEGGTR